MLINDKFVITTQREKEVVRACFREIKDPKVREELIDGREQVDRLSHEVSKENLREWPHEG